MKRRTLLGAACTVALAGGAVAAGRTFAAADAAPKHDYFGLYLDVIRAWKKHDAEAVLAHMADDIEWYVFVSKPPLRGKAAARELLAKFVPARHAENWRVFHHAVSGSRLFVEGVDDFTDAKDHRIAVPYAGVIEFHDDLITGWRDYFDSAIVDQMRDGGPVPEAIEPLIRRPGQP